MLVEQKPYTGIDPNMKSFLHNNCLDNVQHIFEIHTLEAVQSVVKKQFDLRTLHIPFSYISSVGM